MSFVELCRRIVVRFRVRTRYTRALEDELARLRAENHALVNSILGVAGIPPMRMVAANPGKASRQPDTKRPAGRELHAGAARRKTGPAQAADTVAREEHVAALRRRSWQQIERLREIEDARAARRERETDTETFGTPRNIVPRV